MASPQIEDGYFRIARELHMALCKIKVPGDARQMWDVIFAKTFGFRIKKEEISTVIFMELTDMKRFEIYRARKRLVEMKMITVYRNADSQILSYSIQKDYEKWKVSANLHTVSKSVTNCIQNREKTISKSVDTLIVKDRKIIKKTPKPFSLVFTSGQFKQAWDDWAQCRKESGKKLTPTAIKLQMRKLKAMGEDRAIKALEHSTACNYQGLFEPSGGNDAKSGRKDEPVQLTRRSDWGEIKPR